MKRSWIKRKKPSRKRAQSKTDLWSSYGLTRPPKPRYTGRKGIYWYLLSIKVRRRDFERFGACVNCGAKVDDWRHLQGGHFISASKCGFALLFDEMNVHGECPGCNAYDKQKLGYERNLDLRYGPGTAKQLKDRYWDSKKITPMKEWSQLEYDRKIREMLSTTLSTC